MKENSGWFVSRSAEDRFWEKVDRRGHDECWEWLAGKSFGGYGQFRPTSTTQAMAHRFAYEMLVGPIDDETLDHMCNNPGCVNPAHLEPASRGANAMRGNGPPAVNARKTHCKNGHELPGPNAAGRRVCLICRNESSRLRRRAVRVASGLPLGKGSHLSSRTACPQGHPYDEVNTYINAKGHRGCRECKRVGNRERKRAAARARGAPERRSRMQRD